METNLEQNNAPPVPEKKDVAQPAPNPAERFEQILKNIDEARAKENHAVEVSLYKEAENLFKNYTGQNLMEKAVAAAREEIKTEGSKIIQKNELASEEYFKKEVDAFKFKQYLFATQKCWSMLSEEEKNQYSNDMSIFGSEMEKSMAKLKNSGFDINKEIFYSIMAQGYKIYDIRKNFWGKMMVPVFVGNGVYRFETFSPRELASFMTMLNNIFEITVEQAVKDKINKDSLHAKRRWHKRKTRKIREIIKSVAKTIKEQSIEESEKQEIRKRLEEEIKEKIKKEIEAEERETLEKLANIGEVGVLEKLRGFERSEKKADKTIKKEIQKIERDIEKDIKERTEEENKITELLKKQAQKGRISKKRKTYLDKASVASAENSSEPEKEEESKENNQKSPE